jgi:CelD/BcsL family acetyltransferase involved in cellulose biosynthesis
MAIEGAEDGAARTELLSLAGEPLAVQFGLAQQGVYSMLMIGLDIARHARLSPGLLAIEDSIRSAIEAGDHVYDFTIGDHPYKLQFGGEMVPLEEWHRARTLRGHAAILAIAMLREAKRKLKPLLTRTKSARTAEPRA